MKKWKKNNIYVRIIVGDNMYNLTFLTKEQIWDFGHSDYLKVFDKIDQRAAVTDFGILTGAYVSNMCTPEGNTFPYRTCFYWTKTADGTGDVRAVLTNGYENSTCCTMRHVAARPALTFSYNHNISPNLVRGSLGALELEFGEYPQQVASKQESASLERLLKKGRLSETGKTYTTDSVPIDERNTSFTPVSHVEYEHDGNKFVRIKANTMYMDDAFRLSDGEKYKNGDYVWVKVTPISWIYDPDKNVFFSKRCLYSGVRFAKQDGTYTGNFEQTEANYFLQTYFAKDFVSNKTLSYEDLSSKQQNNKIPNKYDFNFDSVSEDDLIKGAIESDLSVFLHGRSSEGKSARIKQIDPDCEILYLRNVTPDYLNGKSVYDASTGKMIDIPPTWYKRLAQKCEKEPDKLHLLFFDEITNALPSIQGMAYNIILDKEVNGIWKLPDNTRVVAAGNETKDSLAASELAEPLFNRFVHVYVKTNLEDWLKWASGAGIHPSVMSFVAYGGERVLRSEYNGETPNADPRKWEMASKMLYKTNNPMFLRGLIGNELTNEFCAFCRLNLVTIDNVINNDYDDNVFEEDLSVKFATATALSLVEEDNLEIVRDFVCQLGAEPAKLFDFLWTRGDDLRAKKIALLRLEKSAEKGGVSL